jgi:hypothetical protein
MNWHLDQAQIASYATGDSLGARAASAEAHLFTCSECRAALAPAAPTDRLDAVWAQIEERVDEPHKSWLERLLIKLRVPTDEARLLASAPSLQLSWVAALALVLTFSAAATHSGERGVLLFLVLAPLVPVAAVAGAFGRGIDPTYEITCSTPYSSQRLLLLRVAAVLSTSLLLTSAVALTVSDAWVAAAWLLPSLAMVGLVLSLSPWVDLPWAAALVTATYVSVVSTTWKVDGSVRELYQEPAQISSLLIVVLCLIVIFVPTRNRAALRRTP